MSGDKLSFLLFFVGTAIAAVMGAIQSSGFRAKALWVAAVLFAAMGYAYFRFAATGNWHSVVLVLWSLVPIISATICSVIVWGRGSSAQIPAAAPTAPAAVAPAADNRQVEKDSPSAINPALTVEYLNEVVEGKTRLEIQKKLSEHENELVRIKGQVKDIDEVPIFNAVRVYIIGLYNKYPDPWINSAPMLFKISQRDALHAIKRGDWIEFSGKVVPYDNDLRWQLVDCEFNGRVSPPAAPAVKRRSKSSKP